MKKRFFTVGVIFLLFATTTFAQTPRELAERIGNRIIADTKFEFQQMPMKLEQEKVTILNFNNLKQFNKNKLCFATFNLRSKSLHNEVRLACSFDEGELIIRQKDNVVFRNKSNKKAVVKRRDYELNELDFYTPLSISDTSTLFTLLFYPKTKNARVYLSFVEKQTNMQSTEVSMGTDIEGVILNKNEPLNLNTFAFRNPLQPFPTPSVSTLANGNQNRTDWRYYNGTMAIAMHDTWQYFGIDKFKTYLNNHVEFFINNMPKIKTEREKYGLIESPFSLYFRGMLLDDMGMQTAAVALSNQYTTPKSVLFKKKEDIIAQTLHQIKNNVPTLPDGTFTRVTPDSLTVQSDDLMMGGYAYLRMGLAQYKPEWIAEAAKQSLNFHKYLLDKQTGLYRHAYSTKTGQQSCCSWARGMGWMMLVNTDLLKNKTPNFETILANYKASCEALLKVQNENGSFNQILTDKTTYLETSATAMFVYAFAEGVNNGWLPKAQYEAAILRGWSYLKTQIQEDGNVKNIVRGTPILPTAEAYNKQKANTSDPRGLGAMLWVCIAMDRFLK
jgi:rhamnogalacturonyl hydrolase YesR